MKKLRLIQPNKCTFGPQYGANCSFCMNETVPNHGITLFSKVRIDVQKLKLIGINYFKYLLEILKDIS